MQLYPLSMALTTSAVLDSLAQSGVPCGYDAFMSAVTGEEYDVEMDSAVSHDAEQAVLSYISFLGVDDAVIEDMVTGRDKISMDTIQSLADAFSAKYSEDDMIGLAEEFSEQYEEEPTMDAVSPKQCDSGYKRKLVIKDGKMSWRCIRLFGRTHLSPAQKQALRKARAKAHTALANYSRKKSMRIGKSKGMY